MSNFQNTLSRRTVLKGLVASIVFGAFTHAFSGENTCSLEAKKQEGKLYVDKNPTSLITGLI